MLQRGEVMPVKKYFTEEERRDAIRKNKARSYLKRQGLKHMKDHQIKIKLDTFELIMQWRNENLFHALTFNKLMRHILKLAGIIKTDPKLGIPQLKGR
jgi:hypothetical protein